ncbi:MAG: glycosyltransferase family 4 protein [Pseudomonadota bacterium]
MEPQSSQLAYARSHVAEPFRLLLDGRKLGDGGIGVYIENTVRGLLDLGGINLTVIASQTQAERVPWRSEVSWFYDSSKQYSLGEYILLPRRIDFSAYDLYHSPHYTLPLGISIPSIVTIHDLIHIEHPEAFYYPVIAKRLIRSAVRRASKVIAVSQDTRQALVSLTGVEANKVVHIPNAIPPFLRFHASSTAQRQEHGRIILPLSAGDRYFVSVVSNCKPHKGVLDLLSAWRQLVELYNAQGNERQCPSLLIVGYGAEQLRHDKNLSNITQNTPGVRVIGTVDSDILRHIYQGAEALVVPSLAEGFCFPALEAQSVGTRVICRPVAALKELVTQNDLIARDTTVEALTAVLLAAACAPQQSKRVDLAHLERFSLSRTAEQLRALYQAVIE